MRTPIYRSYLVELSLTNAAYVIGQNVNFPDIAQLKNVVIFGAQSIDTQLLAASPSGRPPLLSFNYVVKIDLTKSFITFTQANAGGTDSVLINFFYLFESEFTKLQSSRPRLK
jgi:hypothetical protein